MTSNTKKYARYSHLLRNLLVMSWSHCLWKMNKGQTLDQYFVKSGKVTRDWHNMQLPRN